MPWDYSILYNSSFPRNPKNHKKTIIIDIHPDVNSKVFHKDIEGLTSNDVEY